MPWDNSKCKWGTPTFSDADATTAVNSADFNNSVFVVIDNHGTKKSAYTYYEVNGYRICVVGHVHPDKSGNWTIPGNCFIPGWENWQMVTPQTAVTVIGGLALMGSFPGDERYPHPID